MRNVVNTRTACICLASLALASCATTAEYGNKVLDYGKQATSWIGQKVESLYAKEGTPTSVQPQPDGGSVIQYQKTQTVDAAPAAADAAKSSNAPTPEQASPGTANAANTRIVPCTTRYRTDSTGTIKSWTITGEGCKAVEEDAPQHP